MKTLTLLFLAAVLLHAETPAPAPKSTSSLEKNLVDLEAALAIQKKSIDLLAAQQGQSAPAKSESAPKKEVVPFAPAQPQAKARMLTETERAEWNSINERWELFARRTCDSMEIPFKKCGITSIAVFENEQKSADAKPAPDVKAEVKHPDSKK